MEVGIINAEIQFTPEILSIIKNLWAEECIRKQFPKRFDYHVFDGAPHFFLNTELERLDPSTYTPTFADIVYCRRKTTGVIEANVRTDSCTFQFLDVGGML